MNRRNFLKSSMLAVTGSVLGGYGCWRDSSQDIDIVNSVVEYLSASHYPDNIFVKRIAEESVIDQCIPPDFVDSILDEAKKIRFNSLDEVFVKLDDFRKKYVPTVVFNQFLASDMLKSGCGDCDTIGFLELGIA